MLSKEESKDQKQDEQKLPGDGSMQDTSFAEMLEQYTPEPIRQGQYVIGEVLQIDDNVIMVNVDGKQTAVVPRQDLERIDDEILADLSVGDEVTLYVLHAPTEDEELLVSLNKGLEQKDWLVAKTHLENEEPLLLEVVGHNKGGLLVAFGHLRGFVPSSQVPQLQNIHNQTVLATRKAELVGEKLLLKVIEVDSGNRRLVLSAKKAQKELRQQRFQELKLKEGDTIVGRVTNLMRFGAFVDLDGVDGLLHISEIAWQNVENPADFVSLGEEIEVMIQSVDIKRERVGLSRKALLPSPWILFDQTYSSGDLMEGVVTNVTDFGAFVRVADGIEGLVHVSEMQESKDFAPQDVLSKGDTLLVRILEIQPEKQRMSLSRRRVNRNEEIEWTWQREQQTAALAEDEEE